MNKSAGKGRQWMAVFTAIILLMAIGVLAKLYHVSVVMGPDLIAKARERIIQERTIEASRGNIYSSDGLLLHSRSLCPSLWLKKRCLRLSWHVSIGL